MGLFGWLGELSRRFQYLIHRRQHERDLEREMESHREMMGEPQRFGNTLRLREESRDVWGWNWLDDAWRDLKLACRTLRRSPGFAIGAILVLSVGIGLNITLFQIYNLVFLKPPEVRDVNTVVELLKFSNRGPISGGIVPYPAISFLRDNANALSAFLVSARQRDVVWQDSPGRLPAHFVSANWFDELGGRAASGRLFHGSDADPNSAPVVVLSHYFWKRKLGSDPNVVGSTVRINDRPATVIGILPADYQGLEMDESRLWMPIEQIDYFLPDTAFKTTWRPSFLVKTYARLKPGVSLSAARESMRQVVVELARLEPSHFSQSEWFEPYLVTAPFEDPRRRQEEFLSVAAIGFLSLLVLTIACANLSNMVLSRAISRLRELNIRIALGAGRWRVMRLLMAESAMLAGIAMVVGLVISKVAFDVLSNLVEAPVNASIDWRTIVAALGVAMFVMAVIGFLPTWAVSRRNLANAMKDGGQNVSASLGRTRLRSLLTSVQVAGSCILLLLAALMTRDVQRALKPGLDFENVAVLDVSSAAGRTIDIAGFWQPVRRTVAEMSETEEVALVQHAPIMGGASIWTDLPDAPSLAIETNAVEPQYFKLMRIPIVAGRVFDSQDDPQGVIVVSRRIAMNVFGSLDVLGRSFPRKPWPDVKRVWTIVGVAEDIPSAPLQFPHAGNESAEVYFPLDAGRVKRVYLIARARTDARLLAAPMREAAQAIDNRLFAEARLLSAEYRNNVRELLNLSAVAGAIGVVTLLLACIGIFGVISYSAGLRRKEISIRLALGADRPSLLVLLMKHSLWPAAFGVAAGFLLGLAGAWIMESQRVYLGSLDAPIFISVASLIAVTCVVAAITPAQRALHANIAQTLRDD